MPGFRPGKVPRRVLEARMGHGALRQEALRESLPEYYASAVREHDVDVIAAPEIDITAGQDEGDLRFDAVVEIRPIVQVPGYAGLQVTVDRPEATDEEIDRQIDRLRTNGAALEEVNRPARDGDVLTIDLGMTPEEEGVTGEPNHLTDISYTVGSEDFGVADLDANLRGAKVGDIIKFTSEVSAGRSMAFQVLVKAVREQVLPDLTDAWVGEETEFETVEQLRNDLRTRIGAIKRVQSVRQLRDKSLEALAELVVDDPPAPLVDAEVERRLHDLGHRLEAQGATLEQYLQATGQEPQAFIDELRAGRRPLGQGRSGPASAGRRRGDRGDGGGHRRGDRPAGRSPRPAGRPGAAQPRQWGPDARGTLGPPEGQGARLARGACGRGGPRRTAHRSGRTGSSAGIPD